MHELNSPGIAGAERRSMTIYIELETLKYALEKAQSDCSNAEQCERCGEYAPEYEIDCGDIVCQNCYINEDTEDEKRMFMEVKR